MTAQYFLSKIIFSYADKTVLNIEQQSFTARQITALLGNNGAGKSSLLGLLAFTLLPQSGNIEFADQPVSKKNIATIRRSVGLVQQNPYLVTGNVIKNIELGLKFHGIKSSERQHRVANILSLLKIEQLAHYPAKSLSGGEAQKIAIARTLVLDPEVILFDEPFTYLDKVFIRELEQLIKHLRDDQQKTIIFTTHDQSQAKRLSNNIFNITDGFLTQV